MSEPAFEIKLVESEEQIQQYIDESEYPCVEVNPGEFSKEWLLMYGNVVHALEERWMHGITGDFFVPSDWIPSRIITVEVANVQLLQPEMLTILYSVVRKSNPPYCIEVCGANGFLRTASGGRFPPFTLLVERQKVTVYSKSDNTLAMLGLR